MRVVFPLAHRLRNAVPFDLKQRLHFSRKFRDRLRHPLRAFSKHFALCFRKQLCIYAQRLWL